MSRRLNVTKEMLGIEYAQMPCGAIAWAVLACHPRGLRWPIPAHAVYLSVMPSPDSVWADIEAYLNGGGEEWENVGDSQAAATELGDLIMSIMPGYEGPHLSVLIDEGTRQCMTTTKDMGCIVLEAYRIRHVQAVYRWRGSRDEVAEDALPAMPRQLPPPGPGGEDAF